MTNKQRDISCSVIFLLFGAGMMYLSFGVKRMIQSDVGSGFVPRFVAACIIIAALAKLVLTLMNKSTSANKKESKESDLVGGLGTVGLMAAYVFCFESVGFLLSSMVYLFAQILLMSTKENRKPILFAAIAILLPLAVDILFVFIIKMPLPKGILGF